MTPGGRVILLESVLQPGNAPKSIDLEMLLLPGGQERTEEEFRALALSCRSVVFAGRPA